MTALDVQQYQVFVKFWALGFDPETSTFTPAPPRLFVLVASYRRYDSNMYIRSNIYVKVHGWYTISECEVMGCKNSN